VKRDNFYRRDPGAALSGMAGMTLEERGVYNTIIDLLYLTWRPLEDNRAYIAAHCGCAVQKLNPLIEKLIQKGKLIRFNEGGCEYISNGRFEAERLAVKGKTTRSGRGEVREKSAGVREKSASVEENPPTCGDKIEEKQSVGNTEKRREEKTRKDIVQTPKPDPLYDAAWKACTKEMRTRSKSQALTRPFWNEAARQAGSPERLLVALNAYLRHDPDVGRTGGPGFHLWLRDGKWEAHLAAQDQSAAVSTDPQALAIREKHFQETGEWRDSWGERPRSAA